MGTENANTETTDGNKPGEKTSTPGTEFKPITTQDDLNKIISERVKREQSKFADYEDLKAKASKFDELEEANKSEIEKANDRVAKAEAEVATIPEKVAHALRSHLIEMHEIDQEKADLFLTSTDPELMLRQVKALLGDGADRKKRNNYVPGEGNPRNPNANTDEREFVRSLFGSGD